MKKLSIAIALLLTAVVVHADVLYWMVSDAEAESADSASSEVFAYLKASNGGTTESLASLTAAKVYDLYDYGDQAVYTLGSPLTSPYTDWSFFVELAADGRKTDAMTYQALVDAGYLRQANSMSVPSTMLAGFGQAAGTSYAVPEPTSGLLFLVGGVLLGLKRRRQV